MQDGPNQMTRRSFLAGTAAIAGAAVSRPSDAKAETAIRVKRADRLNVAVVGAGGRGADNISDLRETAVNIVALCDCDQGRAAETFKLYPNMKDTQNQR